MSCRDGWFDLVDTLFANLQDVTKLGGPQVVASDVKEKYGGLSVYHNIVSDEQAGTVELAEALSERICEVCGNRGQRCDGDWITMRRDTRVEPGRIAPL